MGCITVHRAREGLPSYLHIVGVRLIKHARLIEFAWLGHIHPTLHTRKGHHAVDPLSLHETDDKQLTRYD